MFIDDIVRHKRIEIGERKRKQTFQELVASIPETHSLPRSSFIESIKRAPGEGLRLIAEIKKASPSKGELRRDFYPEKIAQIYERCGANAISVLTDEKFFQGSLEHLRIASHAVDIPALRKDFILDEYQIIEAKVYGARAVLLIVSILGKGELITLIKAAEGQEMDTLVEVHNERELDIALECGAKILGINNRDLRSFDVDLSVCESLSPKVPTGLTVVVESGIQTRQDVRRIKSLSVDAILVGEAFMKSEDIGSKAHELMGG